MYISQIIQYSILPVFVILAWLIINYSLALFEKKFSDKE